jgi:hypothetical protein
LAAIELDIVHRGDCRLSLGFLREANKSETTTSASITIFYYYGFLHCSKFFEFLAQRRIICVPG